MFSKIYCKILFFLFVFSFLGKAQEKVIDFEFDDEFFEAFHSFTDQNYDESILRFENLCKDYPQESSIFYYLGKSYQAKNQLNSAKKAIERAYELEPGSLDIGLFYIQLLLQTNDSQKALTIINELSAYDQPRYELEMLRIEANLNLGNYQEAIDLLEDKDQTYYDNPEVLRTKQYVYARLEKWDEFILASSEFAQNYPYELIFGWEIFPLISPKIFSSIKPNIDSLSRIHPDQKQINLWKADYFIDKKELLPAITQLRETFLDERLDSTQVGTRIIQCFDLIKTVQEVDSMENLISEAGQVFKKDFRLKALLGDIYFQKNQAMKARENYRIALENDLGNELMWSRLIALDLELNDATAANLHIQKAIKEFPLSGVFYYQWGFLSQVQGKYSQSIDYLLESLKNKLNMENYELSSYILLGDAYHHIGDMNASDTYYEKVLAIFPEEEYVLNNYSYFLALRGEKLEKAEEMSYQLIQSNPENSSYLDTHGWVLVQLNKWEEAKMYLEKANLLANYQNIVLLDHLAEVYLKLGDQSKAKKLWKKALKLKPNDLQIQRKLADL